MGQLRALRRTAIAVFLGLAVIVWSVIPSTTHAPKVFETIQDHLEMIADHGHSHGFEEDLAWALHGHSHETVDHDHNQAVVVLDTRTGARVEYREHWHLKTLSGQSLRSFRIERPPRA